MKFSWRIFDAQIVVYAILLVSFGLVMIWSATAQQDFSPILIRQVQMLAVGILAFLLFSLVDNRLWFNNAHWLYLLLIGLLVAVMYLGISAKGAQRWIDLGPLGSFQPSEPAKLLLILSLGRLLAGNRDGQLGQPKMPFKKFCFSLVLVGIPTLLILKQPDLGTAIVTGVVGVTMIYAAGASWKWLASLFLAACAIMPNFLHGYQKQRLTIFMNPEIDPQGAGWNIIQSKIAIGSGGIMGKGLFMGTQNNLNFVPEHHTDFIFTVIGEETGLLGGLFALIILGLLVYRAFNIAKVSVSLYESYIALGIGTSLAVHTIVNIGMTCGILPVVGIPLPFISYGGTSIVTNLASLGILNYLAARSDKSICS